MSRSTICGEMRVNSGVSSPTKRSTGPVSAGSSTSQTVLPTQLDQAVRAGSAVPHPALPTLCHEGGDSEKGDQGEREPDAGDGVPRGVAANRVGADRDLVGVAGGQRAG